jgi:hypothetical protein
MLHGLGRDDASILPSRICRVAIKTMREVDVFKALNLRIYITVVRFRVQHYNVLQFQLCALNFHSRLVERSFCQTRNVPRGVYVSLML